MFKRSIEMKIVKAPKKPSNTTETAVEVDPIDYVHIARESIETAAAAIIVGVLAYVAADTLRQVIVKVTPSN